MPDVVAWIAKLAERFGVELSPHVPVVFDEVAAKCFGGITFSEVGERATLPPRAPAKPETVSDTVKVSDTGGTVRTCRSPPPGVWVFFDALDQNHK